MTARMKGPVIVAVVFIVLSLVGLDRSPVVWMDEVTLNDPARTWVSGGGLRSSVYADSSGFERGYYWQPPGQVLLMAPVYAVAGVGVWQTRLPGLLLAGIVLILVGALAADAFGSSHVAASAASVVMALDPQFIQTARSGRMDTQCLALALLGVLVYLRSREARGVKRLAVSGLLVGVAGLTHPVAASWAFAIGASILLFDESRIPRLVAFGAAAALPLAAWLLFALGAGQWDVFSSQFLQHGAGHTASGWPWERIGAEFARVARRYVLAPVLLALYVAALAWAAGRRDAIGGGARLPVLAVVSFLFVALLMTKADAGFYFLHPVALAAVMSGGLVAAIAGMTRSRRVVVALFVLAAIGNSAAAGFGARWAALAFQWRERSYTPVEQQVAAAIGPGAIVWGREESWYALVQRNAQLRVTGRPDARRHDFAIVRPESASIVPQPATLVASIGSPLPPLFGRIVLPSQDYRLQIWKLR